MAVDGVSPFENDHAFELIEWLEHEPTNAMTILNERLQEVISEEDYIEVDACCMGLATAELVAAINGNPSPDLPDYYTSWVTANPSGTDKTLIEDSLKAIERIRQKDTELYQLFEEGTESPYLAEDWLADWAQVLDDLVKRLQPSL